MGSRKGRERTRARQTVTAIPAWRLHAELCPSKLPKPRNNAAKLRWVEVRGRPDYLDPVGEEINLKNGRTAIVHPPPDLPAYRTEIRTIYQRAFAAARTVREQAKVLQRFGEHFPHLVFDPEGWLWPYYQTWRSGYEADDEKLLRALARGAIRKGAGWQPRGRDKAWRLAQGKKWLARSGENKKLQRLYQEYLEGIRSRDAGVRKATVERCLPPLLRVIEEQTGYRATPEELDSKKLNGVLRKVVAKRLGVRERDLH